MNDKYDSRNIKSVAFIQINSSNLVIIKSRRSMSQFPKKQITKLITATFQVHREGKKNYCSEDFLFKELLQRSDFCC